MTELVRNIAYVRSGDKGNVCTVGLIAKDPARYQELRRSVTAASVKELLGDWAAGEVQIYPMDNISAILIAIHGGLGGGATATIRFDQTGKALGYALLRLTVVASGG